jgi:hypothetical protein
MIDVMALAGEVTRMSPTPIQSWSILLWTKASERCSRSEKVILVCTSSMQA